MNSAAHLIFNDRTNPRNWQDDFPHENGNYLCKCSSCGLAFLGHKRRITCRVCYGKSVDVLTELSLPKILDMVMSESELATDCFNPNETDEQYFLRRKKFWEDK